MPTLFRGRLNQPKTSAGVASVANHKQLQKQDPSAGTGITVVLLDNDGGIWHSG